MGLFGLSKKEQGIWNMIQAGDRARIKEKGSPANGHFASVLGTSRREVSITTPILGTSFWEVAPRTRVDVEIDVSSVGGGRVAFSSRVLAQEWGRTRCTKIVCPRTLSWVQLRRYVRLDVVVDVEFSLIEPKKASSRISLGYPRYNAVTKNLSEGGLLCLVPKNQQIESGKMVDMRVKFDRNDSILVRGRILRQLGLSVQDKYGLGVQFVSMSSQDKERLRKFIFETGKRRNIRTR